MQHEPAGESRHPARAFDTLLLDFGGVVLLNPVELHAELEARLGLAPGTFDWLGPLDPTTDEPWRRMIEGGDFTERDYWQLRAAEVGARSGRTLDVRGYMKLLYDPPTAAVIRPAATATVRAARAAGYGVSVLTNDLGAFHGPEWQAEVGFFDLVDHLVDCSETGILKPDPRAYQRALDLIGCPADRVLFVDDQPGNVEGARRFGLAAVAFDIARAEDSWVDVADRLGL